MAYIVADMVKSAVGVRLKEEYPDITWYKEDITEPKYPNFMVYLIQPSIVPIAGINKYNASFLMSVKYRHASDPTTVTGLNSILDNIGLNLCDAMDKIVVDGKTANASNLRTEKNDGIIQLLCDYNFTVNKQQAEYIKMASLVDNVNIKE